MTYSGHVKNGQILLDVPVELLDGTTLKIEVVAPLQEKPRSQLKSRVRTFQPVELPGGPLDQDIIRDRR